MSNSFEQAAIRAGQIHLNAKIDALAEMLIEIEEEDYRMVHQVKGAIANRIDALTSFKDNAE
ncbi:MAG: hypothetical protein JKY81_05740 [Colwellia sp.]|nr:hypothetical protein [Colwellia sp.]